MAKRIANRIAVLTLLALLLAALPTAALAAVDVDPEKSCTLTLRSVAASGGVPNVSYALYRVASVSGSHPDFAVLPGFASYPVNWAPPTVSKWNDLALTLKGLVLADGVTPDASGSSDAHGNLTLDGLTPGLYLVVGKITKIGQKTYTPSPCLVALPVRNEETTPHSWTYSETIRPKYSLKGGGSGGGSGDRDGSRDARASHTEECRAIKVWEDDPVQRPDKITVSLYCDGALYQTAELTEANSWRAVFSELREGCDWTLTEDTPENYTVSVAQEGTAFLVTNTPKQTDNNDIAIPDTNDGEPIPPDESDSEIYGDGNPEDGGNPTPGDGEPTVIDIIEHMEVYPGMRLPQLGLLWWPVPLLLGFALFCILLGMLFGRSGRCGRRTRVFAALGLACVAAAAALTLHNLATQDRAADAAEQNLSALRVTMPLEATGVTTDAAAAQLPDYQLNPDMPMPTAEIDEVAYIGVLSLPTLKLELPVAAELSDATLYKAPCCYAGSPYQDNLIIAAHNYRRHFGPIHRLRAGDAVTFTDMDGNVFRYTVAETEVLQPEDVERMLSTDYALTLFTCTLGGQQRITVRCTATK